jgi:hypothetical protein
MVLLSRKMLVEIPVTGTGGSDVLQLEFLLTGQVKI